MGHDTHGFGRGHNHNHIQDHIHDRDDDGVDRRGFLRCMAWAGTGMAWVASAGILRSAPLSRLGAGGGSPLAAGDFVFAQISDSHIGFSKDANKDVISTLQTAIGRVKALPVPPDFLIHTGDLTHLSKPEEFDTLQQVLTGANVGEVFYVPGEHDMLVDDGRQYLEQFGRNTLGRGWFSFDHKGVHFIGLVNVLDLKAGGLGNLGGDQLAWLKADVQRLKSSTPIVVFAHIPLWSVYPEWGWGTDDGAQALSYLKRFGSVTVLNGHIHQTLQKVEGHMTFHTAASTAFPQPMPGMAPSPGPMTVPADHLRGLLGLSTVTFVQRSHSLAIVDHTLDDKAGGALPTSVKIDIDNFKFGIVSIDVAVGASVTWTNRDDVPHTVASSTKLFKSPPLDTGEAYTFRFDTAGRFEYFCSLHPRMTGTIVVR